MLENMKKPYFTLLSTLCSSRVYIYTHSTPRSSVHHTTFTAYSVLRRLAASVGRTALAVPPGVARHVTSDPLRQQCVNAAH